MVNKKFLISDFEIVNDDMIEEGEFGVIYSDFFFSCHESVNK